MKTLVPKRKTKTVLVSLISVLVALLVMMPSAVSSNAQTEKEHIYYSDLFWGLDTQYLLGALDNYRERTNSGIEAINNEYPTWLSIYRSVLTDLTSWNSYLELFGATIDGHDLYDLAIEKANDSFFECYYDMCGDFYSSSMPSLNEAFLSSAKNTVKIEKSIISAYDSFKAAVQEGRFERLESDADYKQIADYYFALFEEESGGIGTKWKATVLKRLQNVIYDPDGSDTGLGKFLKETNDALSAADRILKFGEKMVEYYNLVASFESRMDAAILFYQNATPNTVLSEGMKLFLERAGCTFDSVSPKVAISETLPSDEKAFAILNQLRRDVSVEMKSDKSGETDLEKDNFVESMMSHSTIVLNSIEKDNCSVTITAPDISGLMNEAVDSISLDQDLDTAKEQLLMFLIELINGDNPPILTRELSLPISKTDEGYSIEYDETFLDAIFGGFFTYVNKEGNDQ